MDKKPSHLEHFWVVYFTFSTILLILLVSISWEYALEDITGELLGIEDPESEGDRVEFVITTFAFSTVGLIIAGVILFIVDRRRLLAERALEASYKDSLRTSEERFAMAQIIANIGTWEFDFISNRFSLSDEVSQMFGVDAIDIEFTYINFLKNAHRGDLRQIIDAVNVSLKDGIDFNNEWRIQRPDKSVHWVSAVGRIFRDKAGAPLRMIGTVQEITDRKQSEHELLKERGMLLAAEEAADIGSWEWIPSTNNVSVSSNFCKLFGIEPEQFDGEFETLMKLFHPDDLQIFRNEIKKVLTEKKPRRIEFRIIKPDGTVRDQLGASKIFFDEAGNITKLVGIVQDVTEQKVASERQRALEKQILHTQKLESLGVLAGGIAHDFNNILTSILGNTDLAIMELPPASPVHSYMESVRSSSKRAADLSRQMLAYSGKGRFVIQHISMNDIIEEMAHLLDVSISKTVVLKYDLAKALPAVEADVTQMNQIIMNLIINASEAIGEKSGLISIRTGAIECREEYLRKAWHVEELPAGLYVYLEISDTGDGMDKETIGKVFDPFFTTKFTGRGLGMAAVQGIVRGHKGAIKVYSEVGKGSTFKLLLPASGEVAVAVMENTDQNDAWVGKGVVLLADDEDTVRSTGKKMLEKLGYTVVPAADGLEAMEIFHKRADEFTLVILDLTMPHMGGEECFRELRQVKKDICIIVTSGYNEQDVVQRFLGKQLSGFIAKPFQVADMRRVIIEATKGDGKKPV